MIQTWKIAREVERVVVRGQGLLSAPYEAVCRQKHRGFTRRSGDISDIKDGLSRDVAIFAIYQPGSLSESTFSTLRHLVEKGFATIVVSNAPLTAGDHSRLNQYATAIYQRKNFGYDMGAFQDALKVLPGMGAGLNSLILINDSIWFPIRSNARLIDQMRVNPAAAVAAQMFNGRPRRTAGKAVSEPILGSYLVMFKSAALRSAGFQNFWRDYRMSSNKEITIRRGERGLSSALFRAGISMAGVYGSTEIEAALARCSPADLCDGLANMILFKPKDRKRRAALMDETRRDANWENLARQFMRDMAGRKNVTSVLPTFCIDRLGVEIVKKNKEMHYRLARRFLSLAWHRAPNGTILRPFLQELDARTKQDVLPSGLYAMCCDQEVARDSNEMLASNDDAMPANDLLSKLG